MLSNLSTHQKDLIEKIGFSSLLGLQCLEVPNDLYHWLLEYFDPTKSTLILPNGFSYTFNDKCVHKILGIPIGPRRVDGKGTVESCYFFKNQINSIQHTPSVEELCTLIKPDLHGDEFVRIFMLLALSAFLCPNTRSVCSTRYYAELVDVKSISEFNWCSFVLEWFLSYTSKYKKRKLRKPGSPYGGCCHILVVMCKI